MARPLSLWGYCYQCAETLTHVYGKARRLGNGDVEEDNMLLQVRILVPEKRVIFLLICDGCVVQLFGSDFSIIETPRCEG